MRDIKSDPEHEHAVLVKANNTFLHPIRLSGGFLHWSRAPSVDVPPGDCPSSTRSPARPPRSSYPGEEEEKEEVYRTSATLLTRSGVAVHGTPAMSDVMTVFSASRHLETNDFIIMVRVL